MRKIVTIIAFMIVASRAYGTEVEYVGGPERWNPVDISTIYTQKIIVSGEKISVTVKCGSGLIGIGSRSPNFIEPNKVPYGEDVFVKVCGKKPELKPENKEHHPKSNIQGVISADTLPAIRKRVSKSNKVLSKRISKGNIPELPLSPEEDAAYKQLALNDKSIIPDKDYIAECFHKKQNNSNRNYMVCNMFFPGKFTQGNVPMRYVHYIEEISSNAAKSFQRGNSSSFWITALVNVQGGFSPICSFIYDKEFDLITPIYSVR